jgi:hypothetical protein
MPLLTLCSCENYPLKGATIYIFINAGTSSAGNCSGQGSSGKHLLMARGQAHVIRHWARHRCQRYGAIGTAEPRGQAPQPGAWGRPSWPTVGAGCRRALCGTCGCYHMRTVCLCHSVSQTVRLPETACDACEIDASASECMAWSKRVG